MLLALSYFFSNGFSYTKLGEQLQSQAAVIVKNIRAEFLINDLKRYFFILSVSSIAIGLIIIKPNLKTGALVFLIIVIVSDFANIQSRKKIKYVNE